MPAQVHGLSSLHVLVLVISQVLSFLAWGALTMLVSAGALWTGAGSARAARTWIGPAPRIRIPRSLRQDPAEEAARGIRDIERFLASGDGRSRSRRSWLRSTRATREEHPSL